IFVLPGKNRCRGHDEEVLAGKQVAKTAEDRCAPPLGSEIILRRKLTARLDVPNDGRREFGPPVPQQCAIAVSSMGGPQRTESFDGAATIGKEFFGIYVVLHRIETHSKALRH